MPTLHWQEVWVTKFNSECKYFLMTSRLKYLVGLLCIRESVNVSVNRSARFSPKPCSRTQEYDIWFFMIFCLLFQGTTMCFWPSGSAGSSLSSKAKNHKEPRAEWDSFAVKIIVSTGQHFTYSTLLNVNNQCMLCLASKHLVSVVLKK